MTEPGAGLDTSRITTFAKRDGDHYVVNGRKVWISKAVESEKILLLTRTQRYDEVEKKTDGMTLFLTDLDRSKIDIRPIRKMGRNAVTSNELFIDDLRVPVEDRIGEEGQGFKLLLDGLNPERMLIASEALGIGRVALEKAVKYGNEREVFGRPIGMNQASSSPLPMRLRTSMPRSSSCVRPPGSTTTASRAAGKPTPPNISVRKQVSPQLIAHCRLTAEWGTPRSTTCRVTSARRA